MACLWLPVVAVVGLTYFHDFGLEAAAVALGFVSYFCTVIVNRGERISEEFGIIAKTKSTFLQNEKYIFRDFSETSLNAI